MTPRHLYDMSINCTLTPGASDPAGRCVVCKNYIVRAQQGSGWEVTAATNLVGWLGWGIKWVLMK